MMYALFVAAMIHRYCGDYAAAAAEAQELVALADEKGAVFWKTGAIMIQGSVFALTGQIPYAIQMMTTSIMTWRSTGSTIWTPIHLSYLAMAHAKRGQLNEAWHCIGLAMRAVETTKEEWCEAEVHRVAGEIALKSPEPDAAKAQAYFERALAVGRGQQAKSWELRAAMSLARLWRDQGKRDEDHDLLAPIYGWFTEGFDTLDLKEAKALLDELHA
jgi:predicted ATPase